MLAFPKAKINIGLRIVSKRGDGYHNIHTVFYPVCLSDILEFVVLPGGSDKDIFSVSGIDTGCPDDKNLVTKALSRLREARHIPHLRIHLHKAIPAGAGLGGGSSDAASFVKLINRYFGFGLETAQMKSLALSFGSDCPFFIDSVPSYAEGRGELTTPVKKLEGYHIVLMNPGIHVNTAQAYSECIPYDPGVSLKDQYNTDISQWKELIVNDFESTVFRRHPVIGKLKEALYSLGALYSSMSGSGSSVYGIFRGEPAIPEEFTGYLVYSGPM